MKRLFGLAVIAAGAAAVVRRMQQQEAERDLWAEATDQVPAAGSTTQG